MRATRTIDGRKYLIRYQRTTKELRALHAAFCKKYSSNMSLHQYLVERGMVYLEIRQRSKDNG